MNDNLPDPRTEPPNDPVGRLLSLAGSRPALPPDRTARLKAAVRPYWRRAVRTNARWRRPLLLVPLAAALLAAALGWRLAFETPPPASPGPLAVLETATGPILRLVGEAVDGGEDGAPMSLGDELRAGDRIATGDARGALRLAGGASARLDAGTRLRLTAPGRLTLDRGAVYVDFERDGGPGVEITTAVGTIEEIGTQFEVRLDGATLRLRIREGRVVLHDEHGSYEGRPGEELTLGPGAALARGSVALHGEPWRWVLEVAPAFDLEGRTLAEFLRWAARETGRELRYATPELAQLAATTIEIHGDIAGFELEDALDYVLPACGVRYRLTGDALVVEPLGAR